MGIVNAGQLAIYEEIPHELLDLVEDVLLNRRPDATERLLDVCRFDQRDRGARSPRRKRNRGFQTSTSIADEERASLGPRGVGRGYYFSGGIGNPLTDVPGVAQGTLLDFKIRPYSAAPRYCKSCPPFARIWHRLGVIRTIATFQSLTSRQTSRAQLLPATCQALPQYM